MATLYANSSGNWNGAIWYDVATGQPYVEGTPQEGDIVYSNGYTVTLNTNINIGNGILTNALCSYTNRSGGTFSTNANNRTVIANIDAYDYSICLTQSAIGNYIKLTGNLTSHNAIYYATNACSQINGNVMGNMSVKYVRGTVAAYNYVLTINGNVIGENGIVVNVESSNNPSSGYYTGVTINGNLINGSINFVQTGIRKVIVNGNWRNESAPTMLVNLDDLVVTGDFCNLSNKFTVTNFTIGGDIYYNVDFGNFVATNINYINQISQQWINMGTSPFQIVNSNTGIDYPPESSVKIGIEYAYGQMTGTYQPDYPPESVVLKDYEYGDSDDRKTGTMVQEVNVEVGCVTPEDVRKDVPLVGMGVVGSLVVPSADDVREGVVFDNGSVGTLIVEGGGDRLRIADFGYYTNAQSDTYIVDLTEQDKPKFAVAEERVLIEMFPDLDLENIPDKYFDDLFVKYLKYRLIVEYYRTAGINSTFTPSEPTTEIVNYQNVRNEVWLNSANIYLKAWAKKYPESIVKPQRILL